MPGSRGKSPEGARHRAFSGAHLAPARRSALRENEPGSVALSELSGRLRSTFGGPSEKKP